jgi:hypothetical protein
MANPRPTRRKKKRRKRRSKELKLALLAVLVMIAFPCRAQTTTGIAETTGACSPAVSGNNNQLTINCQDVSKDQAARITSILNRILAKQIDPDVVMLQLDELKKLIQQYIKNATPPPGLPTVTRPDPPMGVVVAIDGDWGSAARGMAGQINNFLDSQGEPQSKPEESLVAFLVRANTWNSNVMDQYKKQFGAQVVTMVGILTEKQVLDGQVAQLARDPVNPIGVRALAEQLDAAGKKYKEKYGPN